MPVGGPPRNLIADVLKTVRAAIVGLICFSLVINVLMLTGPLFMLQIYDRILPGRSVVTLVVMGGLVAALYGFMGILDAIRGRVLARAARSLYERVSAQTFNVTVLLPARAQPSAQHAQPTQDLEMVRGFLSGHGPIALFDLPWMPIYLAAIFLLHPILGLVATGAAILVVTLTLINELFARAPTTQAASANAHALALLEGARRNSEVVGTMGMLGNLRSIWNQRRDAYLDAQQVANDRGGAFSTTIKVVRLALQSLMLGVGAYLAIQQVVSPGVMIAASIIMSRALAPVDLAVANWRGFLGARQSFKRLRAALNIDTHVEDVMELPPPAASLSVEGVGIAPPGTPLLTVQRVDFHLEAGDGLGVIGPSGSGKSSLARVLVGVWPAARGEVSLDGAKLGQWDEQARSRHIGYLPQDVELFEGSVAQNIARFDPTATPQEIVSAAQAAGAHSLIVEFAQGYETNVGEGGHALSAGQCQRIALARALFRRPFLVVLDEPNSNLDNEGEQALGETIRSLRESGSIVVVIAHRPSAIAQVNKVLVLQRGAQMAFGPKEEVVPRLVQPLRPQEGQQHAG